MPKKVEEVQTTMNLRVPESLKVNFEACAANNDQTASQVIRAFMRDYVRKHSQASLTLTGGGSKRS